MNRTNLILGLILIASALVLFYFLSAPGANDNMGRWFGGERLETQSDVPLFPNQPEISDDSSPEVISDELDALEVPSESEFFDADELVLE